MRNRMLGEHPAASRGARSANALGTCTMVRATRTASAHHEKPRGKAPRTTAPRLSKFSRIARSSGAYYLIYFDFSIEVRRVVHRVLTEFLCVSGHGAALLKRGAHHAPRTDRPQA
jgi:hypothetical protein